MSDASNPTGSVPPPGPASIPAPHRPPFPVVRLLYAFGYGLIAWFVLHILFLIAVVQFFVVAINGRANDELKSFGLTLVQYERELLAFIVFASDEQPFPVGPLPKHA
jgi:Domain of unknown function (DUF4389)